MIAPDLERLEQVTREYAEFRSRKSGLGTALGGLLALLMFLVAVPFRHAVFSRIKHWEVLAGAIFLVPLLWLPLKAGLGRLLYGGLGEVKPLPDADYERRKWRWIFGLGLFLLAFQTIALFGFVSGVLDFIRHPETLAEIPATLPGRWSRWLWVVGMPPLYLLAAPWCMSGREEARAYAVLAAQGVLFMVIGFAYPGLNCGPITQQILARVFITLQIVALVWALVALRRGWREHREYRGLLQRLPKTLA